MDYAWMNSTTLSCSWGALLLNTQGAHSISLKTPLLVTAEVRLSYILDVSCWKHNVKAFPLLMVYILVYV